MNPRRARGDRRPTPSGTALRLLAGLGAILVAAGCETGTRADRDRELATLKTQLREKDNELAAQQVTLQELQNQLTVARGLTDEDLQRIFYPERLVIDKLTGGADYDGRPGDDGVTVYVRPVDRDGDVIKVAGDIRVQLYDLANPPGQNFIGEYFITADQVGKLWHGKLLTNHYTIKCPWPNEPPAHPEITVRVTFVDYLTKRVLSAQSTCTVSLPVHGARRP